MDGENYSVCEDEPNQSPRRDLLRSYGSAVMVIGERTYQKIKDSEGTIGWLARKLAFIAFPIFWWIRLQWLSQLSFIDKRIQNVEWIASKIFPQSEVIFSKIDNLARFADSLPDKLDNVVNVIGDFIGELPGLLVFDCAIEVIVVIFKNVTSFMPDFGSSYGEKSLDDDMTFAYERDQNFKSTNDEINEEINNGDEGLKEGDKILKRMDAIDSERTKDGSFVSEEDKPKE